MTHTSTDIPVNGPETNRQAGRRLLEEAMIELAKAPPNRHEASEKLWFAAARALRAVAKERRWKRVDYNDEHYPVRAVCEQLIQEQMVGDEAASMGFNLLVVEEMYLNCFRSIHEVEHVELGTAAAERIVDWVERVRQSGPKPVTIDDGNTQQRVAYLLGMKVTNQVAIDKVLPIGGRSPTGFRKDGLLREVVNLVNRGKEPLTSYATWWGMTARSSQDQESGRPGTS